MPQLKKYLLNDVELDKVIHVKYLGVYLDSILFHSMTIIPYSK